MDVHVVSGNVDNNLKCKTNVKRINKQSLLKILMCLQMHWSHWNLNFQSRGPTICSFQVLSCLSTFPKIFFRAENRSSFTTYYDTVAAISKSSCKKNVCPQRGCTALLASRVVMKYSSYQCYHPQSRSQCQIPDQLQQSFTQWKSYFIFIFCSLFLSRFSIFWEVYNSIVVEKVCSDTLEDPIHDRSIPSQRFEWYQKGFLQSRRRSPCNKKLREFSHYQLYRGKSKSISGLR